MKWPLGWRTSRMSSARDSTMAMSQDSVEAAATGLNDDPYDDPPVPLRVIGHGEAHPAGRAARELGRQVITYRAARGLSQAALARQLGWEQSHLARVEAGARTPSLASLHHLARHLGLEITVRATPSGIGVETQDATGTEAE